MQISKPYRIISLFFFISFFCSYTYASTGYTEDEIKQNQALLKQISLAIINVQQNIDWARNDLRKKHSQEAYRLWAQYKNTSGGATALPDVNGLQQLNLSDYITDAKPVNGSLRNYLKTLVGKSNQTVFSEETINNINQYIIPAINNGNLNVVTNPMTSEPSIEIRYNFPNPVAKVSTKQDNAPPPPSSPLVDKNEMIVVLGIHNYIEALKLDRNALNVRNSELKGKITSIY